MGYDEELIRIIKKYNLDRNENNINSERINAEVINILKNKCKGKKMAMWGVGDINNPNETYVYKFLDKYIYYLGKVNCLVDARDDYMGKKLLDIPIIKSDELEKYDVEVILITSFRSRKYIAEDIKTKFPQIYCLDIYEELEKNGIKTEKDIFKSDSRYVDIYFARKKYELAVDEIDKSMYLKDLIARYLDIRDIYYATFFMKEYVDKNYNGWEEISKCVSEVEILLKRIKENTIKRKDIVLAYIDALRSCDWYDKKTDKYKILKNISNESKCFLEVNSTASVTYESMYSAMTGNLPLDGDVYNRSYSYRIGESKFFNRAIKKGYSINVYFPELYKILDENKFVKYYYNLYITEHMWNLICRMAEEEKRTIHFFYAKELHIPFLCGYFTDEPIETVFSRMGFDDTVEDREKVSRQFKDCLQYVQLQIEYFWEYFGERSNKIIFSDHSHIVCNEKNKPYYMYYNDIEKSVHNVLMISGENVIAEKVSNLVSMRDFNKIILPLLDDKDVYIPEEDIIEYQYYPVMNKSIRECSKLFNGEKYIDGIKCFRNKNYLVVFTKKGLPEIYRLEDENKVSICDSKEGKDFLRYIQKNYDVEF